MVCVWYQRGVLSVVVMLLALTFMPGLSPPAWAAGEEWPRRFQGPKGEVVMYQPQLEDYKDDQLTARAAVSARKKEWTAPVFGAVWMDARVAVDRDSRTAKIYEVKVRNVKFPSAKPEELDSMKTFLNEEIEGDVTTISLDRLVAAMELVEKQRAMDEDLNDTPPKIIYRNQPAVLVLLDGEPRLLPIPESTLMRVANTPFTMLYALNDKAYFLKAGESWITAFALQGPWKQAESLPASIRELDEKGRERGKRPSRAAQPALRRSRPRAPNRPWSSKVGYSLKSS
jgi:hypothetical protein